MSRPLVLPLSALVLLHAGCTPLDAPPGTGSVALTLVAGSPSATWTGDPGEGVGGCFVGVGDLNRDGFDDVLIGADGSVGLHHGSASGPERTPAQVWISEGPACAVVGDVDGDGFEDLLVTSGESTVELYAGSSSGWAETRTSRLSGFVDTSTADLRVVGDVDGDGDVEVQDASGVVWLGGPGGLSASRPGPAGGAYGDFDGDGDVDRVALARGSACTSEGTSVNRHELRLYRGSSTGLGTEGLVVFEGACVGTGGRVELDVVHGVFSAGDLDGDGNDDIVAAVSSDVFDASGVVREGEVSALALGGRGAVPWIAGASVSLAGGPTSEGIVITAARDTNCDGSADVLMQGTAASDICWLFDGHASDLLDLSTQQQLAFVQPTGAACAGVGDLDGDGADDVLWGDTLAADGAGEVRFSAGNGVGCPLDRDLDGFDDDVDCNDADADVFPGAEEGIGDGVDQDCDGTELCYVDVDQDGYRTELTGPSIDLDCDDPGEASTDTPAGDCDDRAPEVNPGAEEVVADGVDSDCDGRELCWEDDDGDGWRTEETVVSVDLDCEDAGEGVATLPVGDCDDQEASVNPGRIEEPADGVDQNCDGQEQCFIDADDDGVRVRQGMLSDDADCDDPGEALGSEPDGDCDDQDPLVYPGAEELPGDGIDQDCDGIDAEKTGCSALDNSAGAGLGLAGLLLVLGRRRRAS